MTLTVDLPPEQELELQKQAAEHGAATRPFYETATPEEWVASFHEWTHSHDPNDSVLLDDSREMIYED